MKNTSNLLPRVSSSGSEMDWIEPAVHFSNSRALQPYEQVYDAFHLLQRDPSVQVGYFLSCTQRIRKSIYWIHLSRSMINMCLQKMISSVVVKEW